MKKTGFSLLCDGPLDPCERPNGFVPQRWMRHQIWEFLMVALGEGMTPDASKMYYCTLCLKWLKTSGSTGNCIKHVDHKHKNERTLVNQQGLSGLGVSMPGMLLMVNLLKNHLPFTFVEDPTLRLMTGVNINRRCLSKYADETSVKIHDPILQKLAAFERMTLAFHEWSDASHRVPHRAGVLQKL
jgi:hypothetical protein